VYRKAATLEKRIIDRQFIFVFFMLPVLFWAKNFPPINQNFAHWSKNLGYAIVGLLVNVRIATFASAILFE